MSSRPNAATARSHHRPRPDASSATSQDDGDRLVAGGVERLGWRLQTAASSRSASTTAAPASAKALAVASPMPERGAGDGGDLVS